MQFFIKLAVVAMLLTPAMAQAQDDDLFGGFDGRWEGFLNFAPAEAFDRDHGYQTASGKYAIAINGAAVSVYIREGTEWKEADPGAFRIVPYKTNAVVFAHGAALGQEGGKAAGWVETWNFTITHKDTQTLYVALIRSINNVQMGPNDKADGTSGRFFTMGFGEFDHVANVKVP
jgi:hypothetical protein